VERLLVDYLFRFTTVHRLEAGTEADNVAEQQALERIGFTVRVSYARWPLGTAPGETP
jgi:RimJ/RimL family protein N-acetyltransferase